MTSALPWVLVAVAVLLWPGRTATGAHVKAAGAGSRRRRHVPLIVAVFAAGALGVVLAGIVPGVVVAAVAWPVTRRLLDRARSARGVPDPSLPLALDLVAAVLRSGRPVPDALALAAPAAGDAVRAALTRTARLLTLGAEPALAWAAGPEAAALGTVADVAIRSHTSGVRLAGAFEQLAADLRADRAAFALARAQRAGTQAMGPLAACFLPSFVCLGIVPVIAGIATTVVGSLH